jgi:hypothetical protein
MSRLDALESPPRQLALQAPLDERKAMSATCSATYATWHYLRGINSLRFHASAHAMSPAERPGKHFLCICCAVAWKRRRADS